jgi:aminoglycoside/choline kinase family phosphotransferase
MPGSFEPQSLAFLNVAELFRAVPIRIPEIHHVSGEDGILLLEDLGDELLQKRVRERDGEGKRDLYREAVSIVRRLQKRGAELESESFFPYRLAFDETKLFDELVFFEEHFISGLRQSKLTDEDKEVLRRSFKDVALELARRPRVLCHRDYHSRNLMVQDGDLAVIDFQDARMGPITYDLVSLLRDSYVTHEQEFVTEMVEEFLGGAGKSGFDDEFELMALQRNLKALGTFGYQILARKNDVYRPYVVPTLEMIRKSLFRNSRWDGLRRALARYLPEID